MKTISSPPIAILPLCLALFAWNIAFFSFLGWKPPFPYNAQRYFEIYLLTNLLCLLPFLPWRLQFTCTFKYIIGVAATLAALVLWQADNPWLAWRELLQYIGLCAAVVAVAKIRAHATAAVFDKAAMLGLVLLAAGFLLITLEGLFFALFYRLMDWAIIFDAFINVRFYAELQFILLLLLPAAFIAMPTKASRGAVFVISALSWGLLLFSGTRSALVVFPVVLLAVLLFGRKAALQWLKTLLWQLLCGVLVYVLLRFAVVWYLGESAAAQGSMSLMRSSSSGRVALWQEAWQLFVANPWLGAGPGAFACHTQALVATPHNLLFMLLSEWGGLMTLLSAAFGLLVIKHMATKLPATTPDNYLRFSLFAVVIAVPTASMMQGMIVTPLSQLLIVLTLGWTLHEFAAHRFVVAQDRQWQVRRFAYGGMVLMGLLATLYMTRADLALQEKLLVSPDGTIILSYGPRYWTEGHDHCEEWLRNAPHRQMFYEDDNK